ncbi:hypothetical protein [Alcaligenes endophyticus]|uniref:XRE family transcriptional regulator n=1 Tax=Alcaligenes endophyticus TaxID=1929088 RepID=A0ABT8EKB1_9BURK|nr:hypothetical protein [Alcaligenes endophyticus]MCX5590902.1 hypothetical protein [Alcaligenes endophyticus]MDN4121736.1 hypothetical protein [Alcaligenes endophyticus]
MKLSALYKTLDKSSRESLAKGSGISPAYLYQIATQWNGRRPSVDVIGRLLRADSRLHAEDLISEFSTAFSEWPELKEHQMHDPKDTDKIPVGPTDVITKGGRA